MTKEMTVAESHYQKIPCVVSIVGRQLMLDLEFIQGLYDDIGEGYHATSINAALQKVGFDTQMKDFTLGENLAKRFLRLGRPTEVFFIVFCKRGSSLLDVCENPDAKEGEDTILTDDKLLESGMFILRGSGMALNPKLEKQVLALLPGLSIKEAIGAAGVPIERIGALRLRKLVRHFRFLLKHPNGRGKSSQAIGSEEPSSPGAAANGFTGKEAAMNQDLVTDQDVPGDENTMVEMHQAPEEELLATGFFIRIKGGIGFHPDFEKRLYSQYPDKSIKEVLEEAGVPAEKVGSVRIARLKARFDALGGKNPDFFVDSDMNELLPEVISRYSTHPFVESCTRSGVILSERFVKEAAHYKDLSLGEIFQVFCLEPGLFSYSEREGLLEKIMGAEWESSAEPTFDELTALSEQSAQILLHRIAALEWLVGRSLSELKEELSGMMPKDKRLFFQMLESLPKDYEGKYTLGFYLEKLSVARTTFYGILRNENYGDAALEKENQDERDRECIIRVMEYKGFHKGARQIYMMLPDLEGVTFALSKVRRLMKKYSLTSGIREPNEARRKAKKYMAEAVVPNILQRQFRLFKPNEVLVTDVTYLTYGPTKERAYCSCIKDAVTGIVLSLNNSERNDIDLVKESLRLANENPKIRGSLIHSDQGCLYLSPEFREEIKKMGLVRSMSRRGNCFDNSVCESFFGTLKEEVDYSGCETFEELDALIADYQQYYNNERRRWDYEKLTPVQYEAYLLSLNEEEWAAHLQKEQERYDRMRANSALKAKKKAKESMGVPVMED